MDYLRPQNYYEDLYDLYTIKSCLQLQEVFQKLYQKSLTEREVAKFSKKEKERWISQWLNQSLIRKEIERFQNREKTISEWINKDRIIQDVFDNTPAPKVSCSKCNKILKSRLKTFDNTDSNEEKLMFFFKCNKCKISKFVYSDGTEHISKPDLCPKCKGKIKVGLKVDGDVDTMTKSCRNCNFKEVEILDFGKFKKERKEHEVLETKLLKIYRKQYCLDEEKANKENELIESIKFGNEMYEYILSEHEDPVYEASLKIQKLKVADLRKVLNELLTKNNYSSLKFDHPDFSKFVSIAFTVEDNDPKRSGQESEKTLKKLIIEILKDTNWRLFSDNIIYRLGFLSGRLKGYENDKDIIEMLSKKEAKPKKQLDPEKLTKYEHTNYVQLAKLCAEQESINIIRKKRLVNEPDGFLLEDLGYTCNICYKTSRTNVIWYMKDGLFCDDCRRNLLAGNITYAETSNYKTHFSSWDIETVCGIKSATVRKLIRTGDLVPKELKDANGKTYFTIFPVKENKNFFKMYPPKIPIYQRWHYIDDDGEVVWL